MGGKIKNLLILACPTTKRNLWFGAVFFLVFLGLALPLQFALGGVVSGLLGAIVAIPVAIITLLLQVMLILTNLLVSIAGAILWWVLSPYFMSLPYTHGGIVDIGWPIVRDFINMFFIIALVIIGLATALRIKEYQAKKALPLLIIIAVLINFTPVICGVIIDASNILMNFFLEELTGLRIMVTVFSSQTSLLTEMFTHPFDVRYATAALGKTLGLIAFGAIASFIFFLYSILFVMRYVMIWVLVIVSPMAFFSRIFPTSQRHLFKSILGWDEWWKQFIEWSLIGIVAGFFLYLGEQLMVMAPDFIPGIYPEGIGGIIAAPIIDFMNNLLPYGVVLAFLLIGFFTATSTSAMGASTVTSFFKEQGMAIGKMALMPARRLGTRAIGGAAGALGKAGGLAGKGAERLERYAGKIPILGKPLKYGVAKPVRWATRGIEATAVTPLKKYAARFRKTDVGGEIKEEGIEEDIQGQVDYVNRQSEDSIKLQALSWMAKQKTLQKAPQTWGLAAHLVEKFAGNPHFKKEALDIANAIPTEISEKAKINLEVTKEDRDEMEEKIKNTAQKLSTEIEMEPVINKEAVELSVKQGIISEKEISQRIKAGLAKDETESGLQIVQDKGLNISKQQEQAARNVAAKYLHFVGLDSGDMKGVAKKSIESVLAGRVLRDTTSQHIQTIFNNFKPETSSKVIEQTFNKMFTGKTDEENRKILEDYLTPASDKLEDIDLAARHSRMFSWSFSSPIGKEMNLIWKQYMTDPDNQPTTNPIQFEKKREIKRRLKNELIISGFYEHRKAAKKHLQAIERHKRMKKPDEDITDKDIEYIEDLKDLYNSELDRASEIWEQIKENDQLIRKWEEIERLKLKRGKGGGSQKPPPPTFPKIPKRPPSPSSGPAAPAAAPQPEPLSQPKKTYPIEEIYPVEILERQVKEHLEKIKKEGAFPAWHPPYLIAYLRQKGISEEESSKMTAEYAWGKAEELLSETPPSPPPAQETRKKIPKRKHRKSGKKGKKRRDKEEKEEY